MLFFVIIPLLGFLQWNIHGTYAFIHQSSQIHHPSHENPAVTHVRDFPNRYDGLGLLLKQQREKKMNNPTIMDSSSTITISRKSLFVQSTTAFLGILPLLPSFSSPSHAAVGPIKIPLTNFKYTAQPCPKDKPIPGEKAMKGMKGLCVSVTADLQESPEKDLSKVGVYGFITDAETGNSVLANNPDLSTDAGQFAMIERITSQDKTVSFEFIAAIPMEKDLSQETNGIGPLDFNSIRIISYPGGSMFGTINPCEMNEFSQECEDWEVENGPYQRGTFMMERNPRTRPRGG